MFTYTVEFNLSSSRVCISKFKFTDVCKLVLIDGYLIISTMSKPYSYRFNYYNIYDLDIHTNIKYPSLDK